MKKFIGRQRGSNVHFDGCKDEQFTWVWVYGVGSALCPTDVRKARKWLQAREAELVAAGHLEEEPCIS